MADHSEQSHPSSPAVSTASSPHDRPRELKATKDRNCPFCGQAFTSSSLGRHLDLYIKPKNPKPSDGVHDVDEIRRIRGAITRRQPRGSLGGALKDGGREDGDVGSTAAHRREGTRTWAAGQEREQERQAAKGTEKSKYTDGSYVNSPVEREAKIQTYFNAPNWQATGVINDLPARAPSRSQNATPSEGAQAQRMEEMRRDTAGHRTERPDYVADETWKLQEQAEIGKAAEMALREVLGSLEAAHKKVEPRVMYEDFDFCTLSFPALCLQILPPPPTLFSADPFAAPHTWALTPPGEKQYEALIRMVNERTTWIRNGHADNLPDTTVFKHHVHLTGAYEHWQTLSEGEREKAWTLEVSRSFVGEKSRKTDLKKELDSARQRIQHLEAEYDRLSRCQLPREYLLHPPNTTPISTQVLREMPASHAKSAAAAVNYDVEALLNKWKGVVKSTARPVRPSTQTSTLSYPREFYTEKIRNPMKGDMVMNGSVFAIGGTIPRDAESTRDPVSAMGRIVRYEYETPQVPGIVEAEDDGGEGDAEGGKDDEGQGGCEGERALMRAGAYCAPVNGMLNGNGKRSLEPEVGNGNTNGGARRARVYRET